MIGPDRPTYQDVRNAREAVDYDLPADEYARAYKAASQTYEAFRDAGGYGPDPEPDQDAEREAGS